MRNSREGKNYQNETNGKKFLREEEQLWNIL